MEAVVDARDARSSLEELEHEIVRLFAQISRQMADWLALVAEFDDLEGARAWGFPGTADWLAWRCGIGARAARDHVRVARRLREMPLVREAFEVGDLSFSKVRALARASEKEDEAVLLELARGSTADELERTVRALRTAESASLDVANRGFDRRYFNWWWEADGSLRLSGRLGSDDGAVLIEAIEAAAEALYGAGAVLRGSPSVEAADAAARAAAAEPPPRGARHADALTEIMVSGAPRAQVVLHVDAPALACTATEAEERAGEVCAIEEGPAVPSETARRLACDAELLLARHDRDGTIDYGRKRRVVSPALRTRLERRDRHCRYPGCTRRKGLHAHHIRHWVHGGTTDQDNLVLFCPFHHRLVHEEGFTIERRDGTLVFRRPDGRVVARAQPPPMAMAA